MDSSGEGGIALEECYPWSSSIAASPSGNAVSIFGKLVLCSQCSGAWSGDFTMIVLLARLLRQNKTVDLVCAARSRKHYEVVLRKLGVDMMAAIRNNQLRLLVIAELSSAIVVDMETETSTAWNAIVELVRGTSSQVGDGAETSMGGALFFDDLEVVELIAPDSFAARALIADIHSKIGAKQISSFVAFGRSSSEVDANRSFVGGYRRGNSNEYVASLTEYCKYRADINITVGPLNTGYSLMADGLIRVAEGLTATNYVYKSTEGSGIIKCHVLGI